MSAELTIEYWTPDFDIFRKDVIKAGLKGFIVTKLNRFSPAVVIDFNHTQKNESDAEHSDIIITVTNQLEPAIIMGKSDAGKRFIKTKKYAILK